MSQAGFLTYERHAWCRRRSDDYSFTDRERAAIEAIEPKFPPDDVTEIFLPLVELLSRHVEDVARTPFVLGVGGGVAVGKTTVAKVLKQLLRRAPHPRVDLVTTDGFLLPNAALHAAGLIGRKGFPESYDWPALRAFLTAVRSGIRPVRAPVYSHEAYDIVPDRTQVVDQPDILIVEGVNALEAELDFAVYVDADPTDVRRWYVERFLRLGKTEFRQTHAGFHSYGGSDDQSALAVAGRLWKANIVPNLVENILPTRARANVVLEKGPDHRVLQVQVRR